MVMTGEKSIDQILLVDDLKIYYVRPHGATGAKESSDKIEETP
jgi:hypothetical protein